MLAVVLIALGAFVFIDINQTEQVGFVVIESIGFATMPSIYAVLLVAMAILYGANAIRGIVLAIGRPQAGAGPIGEHSGDHSGQDAETSRRMIAVRTLGTIIALAVYAGLLEYVNFLALTTAFLFVMFRLYGQKSLVHTGTVAAIGGIAFHVLFIVVLKLPI
jgi:hypothetical protein